MYFKHFLVVILVGTLLCWSAWFLVLFNVDPFTSTGIGFFFFHMSLLLSLVGTFALAMLLYYYHFAKSFVPMYRYVKKSFLVSMFVSLVLVVLLLLLGKGFLNPWTLGILLVSIILFYSLTRSVGASRYR
ncbi:hypothetical protein H6758_00125 [Candidatus Nomurabacteria bacterium]|nr:hypothetical protein [Candidatus Nomurabacteria bacterium]